MNSKKLFGLKILIVYGLGLLFLIPLLFLKSDRILFPTEKDYKLIVYTDPNDSAGTKAQVTCEKASSINFNYTLRKNDSIYGKDPYAGFAIELTENNRFVDISTYDFMHIDVTIKHANSFIVNLKTSIEGFTDINDWHTYHVESIQIPVHLGSIRYKVALKDMKIPEWWWKEVGPVASNLPKTADRKRLFGMDFQNGSGLKTGVEDQMIITKIRFSKDNTFFFLILICCLIVYTSAVFFISRLKRGQSSKKNSNADFTYKKLDVKNLSSEESSRIADYIGKNFQVSDLTVEQVAKEVGISSPRISTILQKAYSFTFKQYLNEIRITETKRLLKETDRTITEIGFAVGYNNITHFNRVFRQETGLSPTEFRENCK
jgi:AraC-like DNA-binding protein